MNPAKIAMLGLVGAAMFCVGMIVSFYPVHAPAGFYSMETFVCNDTKVIEQTLTEKYHENEIGHGVDDDGKLWRLFGNEKTFSIVKTSTSGVSCLAGAGTDWEAIKPGDKT